MKTNQSPGMTLEQALARVRRMGATDINKETVPGGYSGPLLVSFSFTLRGFRVACFQEEGRAVFRRDVTEEGIALIQSISLSNKGN